MPSPFPQFLLRHDQYTLAARLPPWFDLNDDRCEEKFDETNLVKLIDWVQKRKKKKDMSNVEDSR